MKTPAAFYAPSPRSYPRRLPELEYPTTHLLRRVSDIGVVSWNGRRVFLTSVLAGQVVGLTQTSDTRWMVYFGPLLLGVLDSEHPELGLVPAPDDDDDA